MEPPIASKDQPDKAPHWKLSTWFWKPWYAKLWWICAAIYWLLVLLLPNENNPLDSTSGDYLMLLFHPFALFWYGGFRALWVWRQQVVFPWDPNWTEAGSDLDEDVDLYGGEGIGFHRPGPLSYYSDPSDIRSPLNPANPAYVRRHRH